MTKEMLKVTVQVGTCWFDDCIVCRDYRGNIIWFYPTKDKELAAEMFSYYAKALSEFGYYFVYEV